MSTNPEDRLVTLLSHWLARHVSDDELRHAIDEVDSSDLAPGQSQALSELREELSGGRRAGDLEMVVRETLEALALGG